LRPRGAPQRVASLGRAMTNVLALYGEDDRA